MGKKLINIILVLGIIVWGFLRSYLFYNLHYAKSFILGQNQYSQTDSWMRWLDQMSAQDIVIMKWSGTLICLLGVFLICLIFTRVNYQASRSSIYLFAVVFLFAAFAYGLYLVGTPYTFQISRRSLHFLQSPLPLMLLFIYHQYVAQLREKDSM